MAKFSVRSQEEGRGPWHTERFKTLEEASRYIQERWQGVEYKDGPASFHTDFSIYELGGFVLADIGRMTYGEEPEDREFVFNTVADKPA